MFSFLVNRDNKYKFDIIWKYACLKWQVYKFAGCGDKFLSAKFDNFVWDFVWTTTFFYFLIYQAHYLFNFGRLELNTWLTGLTQAGMLIPDLTKYFLWLLFTDIPCDSLFSMLATGFHLKIHRGAKTGGHKLSVTASFQTN